MPTLDELIAARGLLKPVAIVNESEQRLRRLAPEARAAFAVLCAQRLMDAHLRLPRSEQQTFTLSWIPVLDQIWSGLGDPDNASAKAIVKSHLDAFYAGPYNHNLGPDGPPDADE